MGTIKRHIDGHLRDLNIHNTNDDNNVKDIPMYPVLGIISLPPLGGACTHLKERTEAQNSSATCLMSHSDYVWLWDVAGGRG